MEVSTLIERWAFLYVVIHRPSPSVPVVPHNEGTVRETHYSNARNPYQMSSSAHVQPVRSTPAVPSPIPAAMVPPIGVPTSLGVSLDGNLKARTPPRLGGNASSHLGVQRRGGWRGH